MLFQYLRSALRTLGDTYTYTYEISVDIGGPAVWSKKLPLPQENWIVQAGLSLVCHLSCVGKRLGRPITFAVAK